MVCKLVCGTGMLGVGVHSKSDLLWIPWYISVFREL